MGAWFKKNFVTVVLVLIALVGVCLIAYPSVANWWNSFHQTQAIASYSESVSNLSTEDYEKLLSDAEDYNAKLAETGPLWNMSDEQEDEYNDLLAVDASGIMGYIYIPKLHERLPIYHGTDESVLQIAIGHLAGTSLPVGGESTHCVVSGHRGLPSAMLFTDLDKLEVGDTWTITCMGRTITYECDAIHTVLPDNYKYLQIEEGKDLCTLVTCTPYGINTHRLLVRGHRVANGQGDMVIPADALIIEGTHIAPLVAIPILLLLLVSFMMWSRRQKKISKKNAAVNGYIENLGPRDERSAHGRHF